MNGTDIYHENIALLDDGTLLIETGELLEKINRVIISQGTWCKIFYQDEGEEDG